MVGRARYAIGFITPYLQADLGVSSAVAALPNSMVAIGTLAAGFTTRAVATRIGPQTAARVWSLLMALAGLALATRANIAVVLASALVFGYASGGMLLHINSALGAGGGRAAGTRLVRANMWSVVGAQAAPLVLAAAAESVGWAVRPLVAVPFFVLLIAILPGSPARDRLPPRDAGTPATTRSPRLPLSYWLAWAFLAFGICVEFSFVTFGAQVVAARTGVATPDATRLASLFVAGMIWGRLVLSTGIGSGPRSLGVLRACIALAGIGALLTWLSADPAPAGLGLFLGGAGVSAIYPLGTGLALAHAPHAPVRASARVTLASGAAIFSAPFALGFVAQIGGVTTAWLLVFGFVAAAALLIWRIPQPPTPEPEPVPAVSAA